MASKPAVGPRTHIRSTSAFWVVRATQRVARVRHATGTADGLSATWAECSRNPRPEPAALPCQRALASIDRTLNCRARVIGRLSSATLWLAGLPLATAQATARIILRELAKWSLIGGSALWNGWIFWYVINQRDKKQILVMFLGFAVSFSLGFLAALALNVSMTLSWKIGYYIALFYGTCYYFAAVR